MSATTLETFDRAIAHAWSEPKAVARAEAPFDWTGKEERIDFDWWEPRYDAPWRRQNARDREAFGGASVAAPSPPLDPKADRLRWKKSLEREIEAKRYELQELEERLAV